MGRCEMEWQISGIDQARMEQFAEDAGIGRIFAGLLLQRDIVDNRLLSDSYGRISDFCMTLFCSMIWSRQ